MIKDIQKTVCQYFKVDLLSLKSQSRRKEICYARAIAIYLCRKYTDCSLAVIGNAFNRLHPDILYNYERILEKLNFDDVLRNEVDFLTQRIPVESNDQHQEMIEELENELEEIVGG